MIPHFKLVLSVKDKAAAQRVLDNGRLGQGPEVEALERELAAEFRPDGAAVCVANGTVALTLAMKHTPQHILTLSTYSCSSAFHAARMADKAIRLSDIDRQTLHPVSRDVSEHVYGVLDSRPALIEDFTHCPRRPAGSIGELSVISLGPTKPLTAGSGGAILGPRSVIENIRDMRDYDRKKDLRERLNWQMSDLHAAIGRSRLRNLKKMTVWRQKVARSYSVYPSRSNHFWYRYVVEEFPGTVSRFEEQGVQTICPLEPWELLHVKIGRVGDCPNAEQVALSLVSLPIWPGMTSEEVRIVSSALRFWVQ